MFLTDKHHFLASVLSSVDLQCSNLMKILRFCGLGENQKPRAFSSR